MTLTSTAMGRVCLETNQYWSSWKVSSVLMFKYGFKRKGRSVGFGSPFEIYYRDFVKGDIKITSAWESTTGYSWLADNKETDQFLNDFYKKHCT